MIEKQRKLRNKTEKHECFLKTAKTQNIIDNTEYFFKNSRNERTKTGTTL